MFIIVEEIQKNIENILNIENKINYIFGEINIKEEDINKEIRIINSLENYQRENKLKVEENDYKEIKEKIKIEINNNIIEFNYYYKFKESGKYQIKY